MPMSFNSERIHLTYLIDGLTTRSSTGYAAAWFGTLVFGIIIELLVFLRSYLQSTVLKRELKKAIKQAMPPQTPATQEV